MQEAKNRRSVARRPVVWASLAIAVVLAALAMWIGSRNQDDNERLAEVAAKGVQVMPFDLERTTHRFEPRNDGGVQTVVADDPGDSEQIELIRRHLSNEAARFRVGDFGDPVSIHGEDMPGLAELRESVDRIEVRYEQVRAGARIWYSTDDPVLADAIAAWFDAQLTDHGPHAERSPSS